MIYTIYSDLHGDTRSFAKLAIISKLKTKFGGNKDNLKSIKEKEIVNNFAKENPRSIHKLADPEFRQKVIDSASTKQTSIHRSENSLNREIKKVDPNFDPNKFKKVGAGIGAVTGVGAMVGLGAINPALAATPGVGPGSVSAYGTAVGAGVDALRIKQLGKKNPTIKARQSRLSTLKRSIKSDNKKIMKEAKRRYQRRTGKTWVELKFAELKARLAKIRNKKK